MPQHSDHPAEPLGALANEQDDVLSRAQLGSLGWDFWHLRAQIEGGRWAAFGEQAIVLHRGPLTRRQEWWIAVINGGPCAALAGLSAAEEQGLAGFETEPSHIVVPRTAWAPRRRPGVKVHISRRYCPDDRHPGRRIPTVRIERALIDGAAWTPVRRRACAIVIAGVQQRLTRPDRMRSELLQQGQIRHRRLLLAVLGDIEGGVHALSELDFARLCRKHRLPVPVRQRVRRDAYGRRRYLDVSFTRKDGRVLNVEIDGAAHLGVVDAWSDMDRDIAILIRGEPTVRFPSAIVRSDPGGVAGRIHRLLHAPPL